MAKIHPSGHICRSQQTSYWSKDVPPRLTISSGDVVEFDTIDGSNGQITPTSTIEDVKAFDISKANPIFGPVFVQHAEPGDALEVEVLELQTANWGWTLFIPTFGLLAEDFPEPHLKIWNIPRTGADDLIEFSKNIRIPKRPFLGVMGVAPGGSGEFSTIPPRDTGGNLDCRDITEGSRLILPVKVSGALFSCGDGHAAQGDGEVCGSAIETPIRAKLRFTLRKQCSWITSPHYITPPERPCRNPLPDLGTYCTMGVDPDLLEATKKAVRAMIGYLHEVRGLSRNDAYILASTTVNLKLSEVVDLSHAVSASIPLNIFVGSKTSAVL